MEAPLPRLGFAAARIFVITGSYRPPPLPREPVTIQAAANRPGC